MTGTPSSAFSLARWEDQPDLAFGLAHVLVEQFRAFDVEEVGAGVLLLRAVGHRLGQAVGHRLGYEGFATTGWTVEKDPLGGDQSVLLEQVPVHVGKLYRIPDSLDLVPEPPHLLVGDIRYLLEHQFLDLGADELLVGQTRAGVDAHVVSGPEVDPQEGSGQPHHPFLVGMGQHQEAVVGQQLLDGHHLAQAVEVPDLDDVHGVVDQNLLAPLELLDLDGGLGR